MYSKLILVGNLGGDPEMRYTNVGKQVTNFSVAETRQHKNSAGEVVKNTVWYRITVWGTQAENCNQYLKKGSKVLVEGQLEPDKNTGRPKVFETKDGYGASYEVRAMSVKFLSKAEGQSSKSNEETEPIDEDSIPF